MGHPERREEAQELIARAMMARSKAAVILFFMFSGFMDCKTKIGHEYFVIQR